MLLSCKLRNHASQSPQQSAMQPDTHPPVIGSISMLAQKHTMVYTHGICARLLTPMPRFQPGYLKGQLPDRPPEHPEAFADVMRDVEDKIMPGRRNICQNHWGCSCMLETCIATLEPAVLVCQQSVHQVSMPPICCLLHRWLVLSVRSLLLPSSLSCSCAFLCMPCNLCRCGSLAASSLLCILQCQHILPSNAGRHVRQHTQHDWILLGCQVRTSRPSPKVLYVISCTPRLDHVQ